MLSYYSAYSAGKREQGRLNLFANNKNVNNIQKALKIKLLASSFGSLLSVSACLIMIVLVLT